MVVGPSICFTTTEHRHRRVTARMLTRLIVVVIALNLAACGIPIQVVKVSKATTAAAGIRYRIRRPAYQVSLQLNPDEENRRQLVISQVLKDKDGATYEATTHPSPFADTDISIVTEDDGALASLSAGETDKTLETITSAIGLAASVAALAVVSPEERAERRRALVQQCGSSLMTALADLNDLDDEYSREQAYAEATQARIAALTPLLQHALEHQPVDVRLVQSLRKDRNEMLRDLTAAKARLDALRGRTIALDNDAFKLIVESGSDAPATTFGAGECLTITLTPKTAL